MSDEPDFLAAIDQRREEGKAIAGLLGAYFASLIAEGFERIEAMELVRDYQACLFDE